MSFHSRTCSYCRCNFDSSNGEFYCDKYCKFLDNNRAGDWYNKEITELDIILYSDNKDIQGLEEKQRLNIFYKKYGW